MALLDIFNTKQDIEEFTGGCDIDLKKNNELYNRPLVEVLKSEIIPQVQECIDSDEPYIERVQKWLRMYDGKRKPKNYPYAAASNVAIPFIRWLVDTTNVRIMDVLFSQKKLWVARAQKEGYREFADQLEDALDWWQKDIAKLKSVLSNVFMESLKTGDSTLKMDYVRKMRTVTRYADAKETKTKKVFKDKEGNKLVKDIQTVYEGPKPRSVSCDDMVISPDAVSIEDAYIVGNRFFLRPSQFRMRVKSGQYPISDDELSSVLGDEKAKGKDELTETKKERMDLADKELSDYSLTGVELYEIWTKFDVDDDGEEDDIVLVVHMPSHTICKAYYNPYHYGFRPYLDCVLNPVEHQRRGDGYCKILESLQMEVDQIHNQRRDRLDWLNAPPFLRRAGSIHGTWNMYPGAVIDVDDINNSVREVNITSAYPGTEREEDRLIQYGQNAAGVSPQVMGMQTAERPVARDTMALIQENNKKFKFLIDNGRDFMTRLVKMVVEMFAQYQPTYVYKKEQKGEMVTETVQFPTDIVLDAVDISVSASSEVMNTEVKRAIDMELYNLNSDYMTKLAGMAQLIADPMVPPELKKLIMEGGRIGAEQVRRLFSDYGEKDVELLVMDMSKLLDPKVMAQEGQQIQQQQMMQQQGQGGPPQPPQGGVRYQ